MSAPISGEPAGIPEQIPELPSGHKPLFERKVTLVEKAKISDDGKKLEKAELSHVSEVVGQPGPVARVSATAVIIAANKAKSQAAKRSGGGVLGQHSVKKKEPGEV